MWRRWVLPLGAAFLLAVGLTLALHGVRWAALRWRGAIRGAQWIWVPHDRHTAQPVAFYAVRDFTLAPPPARALLMALGDAEYVLYLNGKRVGAGGWRPGARLDAYEVGPLLRPGGNRLLVELRSAGGAGGFLASLEDESSRRVLVATNDQWLTFRRHRVGLVRGWLPVLPFAPGVRVAAGAVGALPGWNQPSEAAASWGSPPIGRWGRVTPGWRRPLFEELTAGRPPVAAASEALYSPPPVTGVAGDDSMVLFDWGREVTGYLALETGFEPGMDPDLVAAPPDRQRTALLWVGDAPPRPTGEGAEPDGAVIVMASAEQWLDAHPRRFRYALVIGIRRPLAASVYAIDQPLAARYGIDVAVGAAGANGAAAPGEGAGAAVRGVFGLAPPRLRTPVENEIRRKLKRLASVAGRKEL